MKPAAAFPFHDSAGLVLQQMPAITPMLKTLFERVFVCASAVTRQYQSERLAWLKSQSFYKLIELDEGQTVGEDIMTLYARTAAACAPQQIVHLCFPDRVAYALQSEHRAAFKADMRSLQVSETPIIFQRSDRAWRTHPQNYYALEQMATQVGELLFGRSLDFAWCHVALQARDLQQIAIPKPCHNFSFFAGIILALRDKIYTRAVDWLAWEDPFILSRDADALRKEREQSRSESRKRLSYVVPMLRLLYEAYAERDQVDD
ncbi:MAG: hypothetical protein R3293_20155 [Candidatus Promineifilaceae bacterium]|nr:hypothetical protein [Candidatus Promineifilaceae bacterium]